MIVLVAPVQTRQAGVNTNSRDESSPGTPFGRALGWTSSLESVSAPVDSFGHCATPLLLVWFLTVSNGPMDNSGTCPGHD